MEILGKKENMDCKEFEKLIPDYLVKKLDYPTLKRFYQHMEECRDCREELDIQFLVSEGIHRLEEGNAFDLQTELELRLEETRKSMRIHSIFLHLGIAMEIVAIGMIVAIIVWILL